MAPSRRKKENILARVNFPLYTVQMLTNRHILVGGGGGSSKTGVANGFEIFELTHNGSNFLAEEVTRYETDRTVVMNCAVFNNNKQCYLVAGQDNSCQLYSVKTTLVVDPNSNSEKLNGFLDKNLRKRVNELKQTKENLFEKKLNFIFKPLNSIQTDFNGTEPCQRVVRISKDGNLLLTGGTDGHIRLWKFPNLKKILDIPAHSKEIDDLDFSTNNDRLVSVAKDCKAFIWDSTNGKMIHELKFESSDLKYLFKRSRFGLKENTNGKQNRLFTISNPLARSGKQKAFLQVWDPQCGQLKNKVSVDESLSALAVHDSGKFVGVGTMFSGTISIYIAFSLQRILNVNQVHSMFVTGLEFLPSLDANTLAATVSEASLVSISVDNKICITSLPHRKTVPFWLAIVVIVLLLFMAFSICSLLGV